MSRLLLTGVGGAGAVAPAWTPASPTTSGGVSPHTWHYADSGFVYQDAGTTPVASDGDVVGRSVNQGSDSHNIDQATTARKPTWQTNEINSKPVFRFDGIDDRIGGNYTAALSQPVTIIVVGKLDPAAVNDGLGHIMVDGTDGNNMQLSTYATANPDTWRIFAGFADGLTGSGATDSNWNIWVALFNGASSQFWINGTSQGTGNAGAENAVGLLLGMTSAIAGFWPGDVSEVVIYDPNLSTADINQVANYLADKYGLTWNDI